MRLALLLLTVSTLCCAQENEQQKTPELWEVCDSCTAAQMKNKAEAALLASPHDEADVYVVDRDDGDKRAYRVVRDQTTSGDASR